MIKSLIRWAVPLTALFVIGPLAGLLTSSLRASDGSGSATLLLNASPVKGILCGLGALALAGVAGVAGVRLIGFRQGVFAAGLVLVWAAWGTATVEEVIRRERSGAALWELSGEAAIVGVLGMGLAWLLWRVAVDRRPESPAGADPGEDQFAWAIGLAASLVIGAVMAWLVARTAMKGQAVAAAVVAGVFGALAGRLASHRAPVLAFFGAMAILGVAGPVVAAVLPGGNGGVVRASYAGTLFPLGLSMPLDWLAGAFLGIPMGLSWAGSMTEMKAMP